MFIDAVTALMIANGEHQERIRAATLHRLAAEAATHNRRSSEPSRPTRWQRGRKGQFQTNQLALIHHRPKPNKRDHP